MLQKVVQDSTQAAVFMAFSQISAFKELMLDQSLLFDDSAKNIVVQSSSSKLEDSVYDEYARTRQTHWKCVIKKLI
jgi:uncharacterized membrane protein YukC